MYDLFEIGEILSEVRDTGSTLSKAQIIQDNAEVEGFKEVLKFIFDPGFTTGLKIKKLDNAGFNEMGAGMAPSEFMQFLKDNPTGSDYVASVANAFIAEYVPDTDELPDDAHWLAEGIATKDLQIGVSVTTLNKIFGKSFIPKIGIMRGMLCPEEIEGKYIVTEKIDGNRRLIFTRDTGVEIYTRSGKRDYGLVEIEEQAKRLPVGYVYDSECVAVGNFADSIALRQASASILNSQGVRTGVKAQIFDALPIDEYNEGRSRYNALARKMWLAILFDDIQGVDTLRTIMPQIVIDRLANELTNEFEDAYFPLKNIEVLPILGIVESKDEALALTLPLWEKGLEGTMLIEHDSVYEVKTTPRKTLLKMKLVKDFKCRCTGVVEGDNKYVGMMGAIVVEYNRKGEKFPYIVKVGSGFTDYQRQLFWDNPEHIVGKIVEIESFGESRNAQGAYSLNCPIFKRISGEIE